MQIIKEMEVNKQELYDYINKMIIEDVLASTNANKEIQVGLTYKKHLQNRLGKLIEVVTTIEKLEMGKYEISLKSIQGVNILSYTYDEIDHNKIKVIYEESFDGVNPSGSINHSIMSFFTKRTNKKRINSMLEHLETLIIQDRI